MSDPKTSFGPPVIKICEWGPWDPLTLGIFWQILFTNEFYDFFENDLSVLSDQGCVTMVSLMAMLVPGQLSLPLIIYTRTLFSSFQKVDGKYYR